MHQREGPIIYKITTELQSSLPTDRLPEQQTTFSFVKFKPVAVKEVLQVITNSTSTTCNLDPIPTHLLKKCLHELTPIITFVINESFKSGYFPEKFKFANIVPILKGLKCDSDELKNYRPIANLKFFAKTLERMAAVQLQRYLNDHELHAKFQSGYRSFHSVETALLRITNDILLTLDKGDEVVLVLLDFSSAFDTIKHDVLLQRLSQKFGICNGALDWIESYLSNRSHTVIIQNEESSRYCISQGVPQGCSPLLFTLYTTPLESLIDKHNVHKMFYADDTQLYIAFKQSDVGDVISQMVDCVQAIKEWSQVNGLKLNSNKTEFLHISSRFRSTDPISFIDLDGTRVNSVRKCRNLGAIFDDKFTMDTFVSQKCRSASFALHKIGKIRNMLDKPTTERLIHAFVMCHLDFCNGLLSGIPARQVQKMQVVQNSAARLIYRVRKQESVSPIIRDLHWLPIHSRISFKMLLLAYECFYNFAPSYLVELLKRYTPVRNLRSSKKKMFVIPPVQTRSYGERSFTYTASTLWNNLPEHLKNIDSIDKFKIALKTHLFNI